MWSAGGDSEDQALHAKLTVTFRPVLDVPITVDVKYRFPELAGPNPAILPLAIRAGGEHDRAPSC
jgi:hypothetical protein